MGDFDEGKCVKLKLKNGYAYILCSSSHNKVNSLMEYVYRMFKAKKEKKNNIFDNEISMESNFSIDNKNFDMEK